MGLKCSAGTTSIAGHSVRSEIMNEHVSRAERLQDRNQPQYAYGVRFKNIVSEAAILDVLQSALGKAPPASSTAGALTQ